MEPAYACLYYVQNHASDRMQGGSLDSVEADAVVDVVIELPPPVDMRGSFLSTKVHILKLSKAMGSQFEPDA